jgi:glycosyltransferase involved in cell wall biosynthesis
VKDDENGLLFMADDFKGMYDSFTYLIQNKKLLGRMGEQSRIAASNYSIEAMAKETEVYYVSILTRKRQEPWARKSK